MQKNNTTGRYLGLTCIAAAVVDISYLLSILNDDYFRVSVTSSIYFVSIDVMLVPAQFYGIFYEIQIHQRASGSSAAGWAVRLL